MKKKVKKTKVSSLDSDRDIALDFAAKAYQKFRDVIKAIAMFGSSIKQKTTSKSDIDLVIIIDDCTVNWDDELIAWYREELAKLMAAQNYKKELHINTVTLTAFWEEVRAGEPLVINVLRYGEPLIDLGGFFDPLKVLLAKGKIRPSPEAIFTTMQRSGQHLIRANSNILNSIEGFYWAMVDASHAALMAINVIPPSPEHIAEMLNETFVKEDTLDKKFVEWYELVRKKAKAILHGEVNRMNGFEIEDLQKKSEDFVIELNKISRALIKNQKIIKYEVKQT
ncbi:nucleotidyltransferase domain-containing protein [Candidatus Woesearchaeota archaeon]|nr:nucleotidyltransferase domain-containing protein [Candidatus Woesearchaeota archaeon]